MSTSLMLCIKKIRDIIKKCIFYKEPLKIHASIKERKIFKKYIKNAKYYLEFGCGGSTLKTLLISNAKIFSVESDLKWIKHLKKIKKIRQAEKQKRLYLHHGNIGKVKEWGRPADNTKKQLFPNYSSEIFHHLQTQKIDTVFIDGRFRVACLLMTILKTYSSKNDIIILIHDFWNRESYHIVLKYITEIERAHSLGVFKIKQNLNLDTVKQDYETYKYIAD